LTVGLPSFGVIFYSGYFPGEDHVCKWLAIFRNVTAYTDFITLGLLSVDMAVFIRRGRCLVVGMHPVVLCICLWVASFGLNSINIFNVYGSFGFDSINGRCEAISKWPNCTSYRSGSPKYLETCKKTSFHGGQIIYLVGFWIPFFAILVSAIIIWLKAHKKHKRGFPISVPKDFLHMERTLTLVILSYCCFPLPLLLMETSTLWFPCMLHKEMATWACYNFYWWMYAVNFLIYFTRNPRFRNAFQRLILDLTPAGIQSILRTASLSTLHSNSFVSDIEQLRN